jgi:hypothetical protein
VPEEKLYLFEFTARCAAKACTSAAEIMRCQLLDACLLGAIFDNVLDNILRHAITLSFPRPAYVPEQAAIRYFGAS